MENRMYLAFLLEVPTYKQPPLFSVSPCRVHKILDSVSHLASLLRTSFYKVAISKKPNLPPEISVLFYGYLHIFSSDPEP